MYIACDTETTGLDHSRDKPFCASTCNQSGEASYWNLYEFSHFERCKELILDPEIITVWCNAKYDFHMFINAGLPIPINPDRFEDVQLMAFLCNEYHPSIAMDALVSQYLPGSNKYEDPTWRNWIRNNKATIEDTGYLHAPRDLLERYAKDDAINTMKLFYVFRGWLQRQGLWETYRFEKQFLLFLIRLENRGMQLDVSYAFENLKRLSVQEDTLENELAEHGIDNPNSYQQIQAALAREGWPVQSTKAEYLNLIAAKGCTLATSIQLYRRVNLMRTRYLEPALKRAHTDDQRLYANFNQCAAKTGRLSSSDINLQNLPRPDESDELSLIGRGMFVPSPGYYFIGADYDQQELRIVADESSEERLIALLDDPSKDGYVEVAKLMWPNQQITKRLRYIAKQTTLGIAYWMGAQRFVHQAAGYGFVFSAEQAADIIKAVSERFPGIIDTRERYSYDTRKKGYAVDRFGRHYHVPSEFAYKTFNNVVQGTAAQMMKRGLILLQHWIDTMNLPMRIVNTVHDEALIEAEIEAISQEDSAHYICHALEMATADRFRVKPKASVKLYGERWSIAA